MLSNGNIEMTVSLLPAAYAALTVAAERDKTSEVNIVNAALMAYNHVSEVADKAGRNIGEAIASDAS